MNHNFFISLGLFTIISTSVFGITQVSQPVEVATTNIQMPEVPVPIKINVVYGPNTTNNAKILKKYDKKKIVFSNRTAPKVLKTKEEQSKEKQSKVLEAGDIDDGKVTAYLHTKLLELDDVKNKLEKAGFEILSTFKVDKKANATVVIFTNEEIKKSASVKNRGFAGALRVTIDKKNSITSISNPIFILKAFMQNDYKAEMANNTLKSLREAFSNLTNSKEILKFTTLSRFRFMEGMPYYQDMKIVKSSKNATLIASAEKSKKIIYTQILSNKSIIIGVKLGRRTGKFIKKIGYTNAGLLPYPVLIENGEAKILDPKYYISIMYPNLKISQFMTISTAPDAILKDITKIFK